MRERPERPLYGGPEAKRKADLREASATSSTGTLTDDRKIYRTGAYKTRRDNQNSNVFWSMDPAFNQPGYWIREHHLYEKGSFSSLITEAMPEAEALAKIETLERDAQVKFPPADMSYLDHQWIGNAYRDAAPLDQNPLHVKDRTDKALKILKSRKPPKLGL